MSIVNRTITCTNTDGVSCSFGERAPSPFVILDCEGIYTISNTVTLSENKMTDGATYQGSVAKSRNIVLTLGDKDKHVYNRNLLSTLFKSGDIGTLIFKEDENERKINYHVESMDSTGEYGSRKYTVSLLCDDPFFYAMNDVTVYMSSWKKKFSFPHQFTASREEFGYKSNIKSQNIKNDNASDGIGIEISISCSGTVVNPTLTRVESDEHISIGSSTKVLTMVSGDILTITTGVNNKHVYLNHEGVTAEINEYLTEESVFIQLARGNNNIGYSAESGTDNMVVAITYRLKYPGA